jgi:predicted aspartyl protease
MPFFFYMKSQKSIPFEIVHLNEEGYHLRIAAKINGQEVSLILDSGASQSAFDQEHLQNSIVDISIHKAEQISTGLGTNSMESFEAVLDSFMVGDLTIKHYKAALVDLSHVNHTYHRLNLQSIQGVLGNDILMKYEALIDYKNKQLWLNC